MKRSPSGRQNAFAASTVLDDIRRNGTAVMRTMVASRDKVSENAPRTSGGMAVITLNPFSDFTARKLNQFGAPMTQQGTSSPGLLTQLIAAAIDKAAHSGDLFSNETFAQRAAGKTVSEWKEGVNLKCAAVGFITGLPGGFIGGLFLGADLAYLFSAAGQGCYGIGHIKGKKIDRERDLPLILAIWCGIAEATAGVAAGKIAIKVGGKVGIQAGAGYAAKVLAKAAVKPAGKGMAKLLPMIAAKVSASLAGKLGSMLIPILGGIISAAVNYWVANGLMTAAEQYYSAEYVQFESDFDAREFAEETIIKQL